ncbi:Short-chain dehydrogenase/reductase SDR [Corchorus olitorius]|uniref:Short-chain dehydrogenase/reductase SDR n=1 Tax=Corchorus olitorius TaxID=93759 RepID=A0A1R3GKL7_9ROSI|nr:Short-chain dehydrogenase/reductase SDR [Corchorus olitorius]
MWFFGWNSASSSAEEVTQGIDGTVYTFVLFVGKSGKDQAGASGGIGLETARVLALRGVHVVMAVRNVEAGKNAKEAILKEIGEAKIDVMELDLSSMASVRKFVSNYQSSSLPLNLLINNAGVNTPTFMLSQDNIELNFATNHLGHFLLTNLLLETIKTTSRESNREGRIVNLSSSYHQHSYREGIRFDNINDQSGYYNGWFAYGQSKLANILHAKELARRLKEEGVEITANSVHPGVIRTNILRDRSFTRAISNILGPGGKFFFKSVQQGAATTCYVALHPQVKGVTGEYFSDCNVANPSSKAKDADLAKRLWDFSLTFTNPK